ncbi:anion transporter [Bacillus methanolicus PB1]|uniref:Anion transporter n=1 Tax=Bacillus methanolicus PB1 TaxID=997296 RepID=I3E1R9_BACMT|nr:chromate transporter [Bacillus methanolicus]EIJ80440.1 anion transporter [Bacillus methanolicus PB1]
MKSCYKDLVLAMLRTGIFGFGGGPSVIPLIRYEAVFRYHWLKDEEFGEILAIANTLPGPIATKMAAFLGYKQKGIIGAFISVTAHILPTCLAMVFLLTIVNFLNYSTAVKGMISAVMPVIAVLLGQMTYEFASKTVKGLGKFVGCLLFVVSFLMLKIISIHPAIVIVLFLAYGAAHFKLKNKRHSKYKGISA